MLGFFSLRNRSVLGVVAVLALAFLLFSWRQLEVQRTDAESHLQSHVKVTAAVVATAVREPLQRGDRAAVAALIGTMIDEHWLAYATVADDGGVIAQAGKVPEPGSAARRQLIEESATVAVGDKLLARVTIGHSLADIDHRLERRNHDVLTTALAFLGLGVLFSFGLVGLLFRDLKRLKDGTRRIASGEYGYQLPVAGNDELAQVVAAFNSMSRSLEQAHQMTAERERALRLSEMRLAEAQRIALIGHWEWNYATSRLYWSDQVYRIFGLSPQATAANYEDFLAFVHSDDRDEVRLAVDDAFERQRPFNIVHRVMLRDGEERWVRERGEVFRSADGAPLRMVVTMQDISEVRRAEDAMRSQRYWLETLINAIPDVICFKDGAGRWLIANQYGLELFGLEQAEYRGRTDTELLGCRDCFRDAVALFGASDETIWLQREPEWAEQTLRRDDGMSMTFEISKVPLYNDDGSRKGLVVVGRDVTERKQAEAALRDKSYQVINLLESTTDAYFAVDRTWRINYFNAEAERALEVPRRQALGQELWDVAPELASSFYKRFQSALANQEHQEFEGYYPPLQKWFETHLYPYNEGLWVFFRDVTERRRNEAALREGSARNQAVLDNILDGIVTIDSSGMINGFNRAAESIFGYSAAELMGHSVTRLMPEPYSSQHDMFVRRYLMARTIERPLSQTRELQGLRKNGEVFPLEISLSEATQHAQPLFIAVLRDLSERRRVEENTLLAAKVFDNSVEGILVTDAGGRIMRVNHAFTTITGFGEDEIVGKTPAVLKSGRHDELFYQEMWDRLRAEGKWQGEIWNRRKNGEIYPEWLSINLLRDTNGQTTHFVAIFSDISEKKEAEQRIYHLAYYDGLTELPNRTMFHGRLQQALAEAKRSRRMVGLLYIDLDRFKNINDTLGHFIGDELLKMSAQRLRNVVRDSDTVARLGGDEFVIMLTDISHEADVVHLAQKALTAMAVPFELDGHEVFVTTSIGISLYPHDAESIEDLLKFADTAMYHAKELGRNNYQFYRTEMNASAFERLVMENSLRRALEREEFVLHFQPQNELDSGRIIGVEALLRWRHPDLGTVMPAQFIPVLEETGMVVPVGEWVLRTACRQIAAWKGAGYDRLRVAVNLSPRQFAQSDLLETIEGVLQETGADPQWLEVEITEGSLMGDAETSVAVLRKLKEKGVRISVDDFGTGYSSLSYLKRFPIDTLKIDQSFVRDVNTNGDDAAIAGAIIAMGHSLNLQVLAEGVETCDQLEFLRAHECDQVQGYLFSRPLPAAEVDILLREKAVLDVCSS